MRTLVLIKAIDESAILEAATMIDGPDADGYITIDRALPSPDGPTNRWHVCKVYAFDKDLMRRVNELAYPAIDAAAAALQILNNDGKFAFPELLRQERFQHLLETMDESEIKH